MTGQVGACDSPLGINPKSSNRTQVAGQVGAYHLCEALVEAAPQLRLTLGKDFVPNMMRKMSAAGAGPQQMEELYALERKVMGANTHAGVARRGCCSSQVHGRNCLRESVEQRQGTGYRAQIHGCKRTYMWAHGMNMRSEVRNVQGVMEKPCLHMH